MTAIVAASQAVALRQILILILPLFWLRYCPCTRRRIFHREMQSARSSAPPGCCCSGECHGRASDPLSPRPSCASSGDEQREHRGEASAKKGLNSFTLQFS